MTSFVSVIEYFLVFDSLSVSLGSLAPTMRFKKCGSNALESSLVLASFCAGVDSKYLEKAYRNACETGVFAVTPEQEEQAVEEDDEHVDRQNECADFLEALHCETKTLRTPFDEEETNNKAAAGAAEREDDLADVPDKENVEKVLDASDACQPFRTDVSPNSKDRNDPNYLPKTLQDALRIRGDKWNALLRLCIKLRTGKGGCDTMWIKNHVSARHASRSLNWHQHLDVTSFHFVRLSRLSMF